MANFGKGKHAWDSEVELSPSERFDVVIIYSRNCTIASPWIAYLSNVIQSLFRSKDRPPTSVTSRDVESIVNCNSFGGGTFERGGSSYANQSTVEQVDNERWKCRHVYRKTVASALLQIVLVSRPLLQHIGANANDPLGKLLHPMRVIGLMLGVDESTDINELHMSALYTFKYWPRITMADQDLASIDRFIRLSSSILQQSQPALLPKVARFKITPKKLRPGENKVTLLLFETADDIRHQAEILVGSEEVSGEPIRISRMTWVNPYCASFHVPDKFLERDIIVKVELNIGGLSWGSRDLKCQNKLGELSILLQKNHLIGNPLDLMCQAMKISPLDHKRLDEELAKNLVAQRVPGHLFQMSKADEASETARGEEFPTVLHFAARFGFVELMWLLLECPGATEALKIPNADGHDVVALANLHGHTEIVSNLQSMQEVDDLYIEMERNASENEYCVMHYDQLPPPRPVTPSEEQAQKGAIIESNYLPLVPDESIDECAGESAMEPTGDLTEDVEIRGSPEALPLTSKKKIQPKSCMDELVYMMNMFKDGKINIRQLEIFFEQWKSRKDVVNDVTEKKAVLESMKVILQKQKVEEKKNTAWVLNRMKSVLRLRSAKDDAASEGSGSVVPPIPILPARNIKVSGRSPQSSWSSDRSSAASRLSHDSGTHSDSTEEKKASQANPTAHEYDTPPPTDGALKASSDYAIPPHPRLVTEPAGSPNLPPRKLSAGSTGGGSRTIFPLPRPPPKQEYLEEIFISQPSENKATSGHPKGLAIMPLFEETDLLVQMPIRPPPPPSSSPPPSPPLKPLVLANYAGTSRALDVQHPYERESSAESFYMDMSSGLHSPKRSGSPRNDMNTIQHRYPYQDEDYVTSEEINVPGAFASSNSLVERVRPQVEPQVKQGLGMSRHKSSSLSALSPEISSPNPPQLPPPRKMSVCPKPKPMPRNRSPVLPPKRD